MNNKSKQQTGSTSFSLDAAAAAAAAAVAGEACVDSALPSPPWPCTWHHRSPTEHEPPSHHWGRGRGREGGEGEGGSERA